MTLVMQATSITPGQMEVLQARAISLREAIAKLEAQRPILERQTRAAEPLQREAAQMQLVQVDLQIAGSRAELASVQDQIVAAGGKSVRTTFTTTPTGPLPERSIIQRIDNDAITAMFVMTCLAIIVPLSIGIARRMWRRPPAPMPMEPFDDMRHRMERLEQAVDAVAIEIERVAESQRFVAKVLIERPSVASSPAADVDSAQGLGEGKPFLALGAGPVEAIPVAQRQAVRQSITPH
jgi:hypothetical protein